VGNATKALGGYVLGLVNPLTLTAAAALLGSAWSEAEKDREAFTVGVATTGNFADKTTAQLEAMVAKLSDIQGATAGSAREALLAVAQSGRFTGEQFDLVAAAVRMEAATGQSIDTTVRKFEELAKAPAEGLLKLNEAEHFLTQAQYDRVRALEEEGRKQDAAAEAARIYASQLDDVGAAAEAARPHLTQMWDEATKGASKAWGEAKNFAEFMAATSEQLSKRPWWVAFSPAAQGAAFFDALRNAQPVVPFKVPQVKGAIDSEAQDTANKSDEALAAFKDKYLTREVQRKREIDELDRNRAKFPRPNTTRSKSRSSSSIASQRGVRARRPSIPRIQSPTASASRSRSMSRNSSPRTS